MSTPTHTPGPWTLLTNEASGPIICGPVVPKTCGFQEILWSDDDYRRIVRSVNIAPKLADALREIIDITRDQPVITPQIAARIQRIAKAAKAEWEAQS